MVGYLRLREPWSRDAGGAGHGHLEDGRMGVASVQ